VEFESTYIRFAGVGLASRPPVHNGATGNRTPISALPRRHSPVESWPQSGDHQTGRLSPQLLGIIVVEVITWRDEVEHKGVEPLRLPCESSIIPLDQRPKLSELRGSNLFQNPGKVLCDQYTKLAKSTEGGRFELPGLLHPPRFQRGALDLAMRSLQNTLPS
jgi:hypothetical protein